MPFFKWSKTSASNGTADATINFSEGQPPASLNDSNRAMMAALKKWGDDISGTITTGGTNVAYTVASNSGFDSLANMNGAMIAFVPHATNGGGGGTPTQLNIDALGLKPIRFFPNVNIESGVLIQGTPYIVTYNNADGAFYLQGAFNDPYGVPLGAMLPYTAAITAPTSAFVIPLGQAIDRTIYANLFNKYSALPGGLATYGAGNGTSTFNVPDMQNRTVFGLATTTPRITIAGGNIDGTLIGAGGAQNHVLTITEMPSHGHTLNDPGHTHVANTGFLILTATAGSGSTPSTGADRAPSALANSFTNITINPAGSGGSHTILPPAMIVPWILRVI